MAETIFRQRRVAFPATARAETGPVAFGRQGGWKRKAGRLTKPPPGGSCGLALSECESGRLRKAPTGTESLRAGGTGQAGQWASVQDLPGGKRDFGQRDATGREGTSVPDRPGRTGFRPGSCEIGGTQDFGPWTARRNPGFGRGSCRKRGQGLRPETTPGEEEELRFEIRQAANRQGSGPVGEPAGKPSTALRRSCEDSGGSGLEFRLKSTGLVVDLAYPGLPSDL